MKLGYQKGCVFFLFINGPHHVYHLIGPALKFASLQNKYRTILVSGNPTNTRIIKSAQKLFNIHNTTLLDIPVPLRYRFKGYRGKVYPPVYTRIKKIIPQLKNAEAVIGTSHELMLQLKKNSITKPIIFYLYHGTGTRAYGFEPKLGDFDHLFIPGEYHRKRLITEKVCVDNQLIMVGTPKIDWLNKKRSINTTLFNNNNPIFYYNPHWDIKLSSYLKWRNVILDFFKENLNYNLIFSPHPLVKHKASKLGYKIESSGKYSDNILIDLKSDRLLEGTYIDIANIYIGDVSSMVTEWIINKPRPCIFINAHGIDWKNKEDFYMWNYGSVITDSEQLHKAIKLTDTKIHDERDQNKFKEKFIYQSQKSSSELCANHLIQTLNKN